MDSIYVQSLPLSLFCFVLRQYLTVYPGSPEIHQDPPTLVSQLLILNVCHHIQSIFFKLYV